MNKTILNWSMLASWGMALVYDKIWNTFGIDVHALLVAAVMVMVFGLWSGLYAKSNAASEEES